MAVSGWEWGLDGTDGGGGVIMEVVMVAGG